MEQDNIYDKLKEMLKDTKGSFSILEEQIDVDLQLSFFELINELSRQKRKDDEILTEQDKLYDPELLLDDKKKLLVELSILEKPEAYRSIEKFVKEGDQQLRPWAVLALQHCRISLETSLLDEEQVFISTGLGGKGEKLRYFIVGKLKLGDKFTESQQRMIKTEFDHFLKNCNSELEKLDFMNGYFTLTALIPINETFSEVIAPTINEINQYGDFLHKDYLVTNVKILTEKEITAYFNKKEK